MPLPLNVPVEWPEISLEPASGSTRPAVFEWEKNDGNAVGDGFKIKPSLDYKHDHLTPKQLFGSSHLCPGRELAPMGAEPVSTSRFLNLFLCVSTVKRES